MADGLKKNLKSRLYSNLPSNRHCFKDFLKMVQYSIGEKQGSFSILVNSDLKNGRIREARVINYANI